MVLGDPGAPKDSQDLAFLGGSWFLDGEASGKGLGGLVPGSWAGAAQSSNFCPLRAWSPHNMMTTPYSTCCGYQVLYICYFKVPL